MRIRFPAIPARQPAPSITKGLMMRLTMDNVDISGSTVADKSGNSNAGTLIGSPATGTGELGQAIVLDGATQYLTVASTDAFNSPNFTLSCWFNTSASGSLMDLMRRDNNTTARQYALRLTTNDKVEFQAIWGGNPKVDSPAAYNDGKWHQAIVVGQFDGTDTNVTLLVDAAVVGTLAIPGQIPSIVEALYVGANHASPISEFFAGSIDDARFYDRALSQSEIALLFAYREYLIGTVNYDGATLYVYLSPTPTISGTLPELNLDGNDGFNLVWNSSDGAFELPIVDGPLHWAISSQPEHINPPIKFILPQNGTVNEV